MVNDGTPPSDQEPDEQVPRPGNAPGTLKARLRAARARADAEQAPTGGGFHLGGAGVGLRVGIELAGTLAVGVGIGWLLDRWLGTGPWLLVVFFFLGAAGGVLNVYRVVKNIGLAVGYRRDDEGEGNGGAG
jgi:ATP synthase protein I